MNEKCNATQIEEDIMCEAAQESLGRIWTIGVMVASAGPVIFGFVQPKIGLCYTRLICGSSTTVGLFLMSYYKVNPAMLFFGAIFCKYPSIFNFKQTYNAIFNVQRSGCLNKNSISLREKKDYLSWAHFLPINEAYFHVCDC